MEDALGWEAEDLVVTRAEAQVLNYALLRALTNEDVPEPFYLTQLVAEVRVSRPAASGALRRLVERGWLEVWAEAWEAARSEGRPARTYYELSIEGRDAAKVLLGAKGADLVGAIPRRRRGRGKA